MDESVSFQCELDTDASWHHSENTVAERDADSRIDFLLFFLTNVVTLGEHTN